MAASPESFWRLASRSLVLATLLLAVAVEMAFSVAAARVATRVEREGWITADERKQLEELRELTWDAISVDDFDPSELVSAGMRDLDKPQENYRAA